VDNRVFYALFELVGEDLLAMVEESRTLGSIVGGLNSTFLTLIPKANNPKTFEDFRPISLVQPVLQVNIKNYCQSD
jgi:hypothetical protein